jgi:hypothetical protein
MFFRERNSQFAFQNNNVWKLSIERSSRKTTRLSVVAVFAAQRGERLSGMFLRRPSNFDTCHVSFTTQDELTTIHHLNLYGERVSFAWLLYRHVYTHSLFVRYEATQTSKSTRPPLFGPIADKCLRTTSEYPTHQYFEITR